MLFRQIVLFAVLVGASAGLVLTLVEAWQVIPIIHSAERYEGVATADAHADHAAAHVHDHGAASAAPEASHQHAGHDHHSADEWAPENGIERTAYTLLSNVLTAIGFALLVIVAMTASARRQGVELSRFNWRYGLVWGIVGYAVFWIAPALGLPPEIPLAATGPLEARQLWWLLAVVCTGAGLAGLVYGSPSWRWAAPFLLLVPHVVGAPRPPGPAFADQPPEIAAQLERLASQFIGATAFANAVFWLILGLGAAWAISRIVADDVPHAGTESPSL